MGVIDTGIIHGAVLGALRRLLTAERTDVSHDFENSQPDYRVIECGLQR